MQEALERQRAGIVHKQITNQREFKGQAFMPKPEIVSRHLRQTALTRQMSC